MHKKIILLLSVYASLMCQGQFNTFSTNFGRTNAVIRTVGLGNFAGSADLRARLHVNNFLMNEPANATFNGFLFRTDGDQAVDNRWQLFTGTTSTSQTERFRIRTLATGNGFDTWLERTQAGSEADIRLLTAEVQLRARGKRLGDFCELAGALADEVIMGDGTDVNFTALSSTNRRLILHGTDGFLGLGSLFAEAGPVPNYHFHINESLAATQVYQQFTNGTTGSGVADGFRLGINVNTSYEVRAFEPDIWLDFAQNNAVRMRMRDDNTWNALQNIFYQGAWVNSINDVNRIMIPLTNADANHVPISMMQLGSINDGNLGRSWMNVGTTYGTNEDAMYVGWMERANAGGGNTPQSDGVIAWGCQRGASNNSPLSDNFRIIFLAPTFDMNADNAGTLQGKEVFRIEPFSGNTGIGNYSASGVNPPGNANYIGAKLDIDGDLRIRTVTQDDALTQVLVRDPNDLGRVHWRDAASLGSAACDWNVVNGGLDVATGYAGACVTRNVGIGTSTPLSKFTINNALADNLSDQTVAITSLASGVQSIHRGMWIRTSGGLTETVGIRSDATALNNGVGGSPLIGVSGVANAQNFCFWRSIGVYGRSTGSSSCGSSDAGYFAGNVVINGTYLYGSDAMLKNDIETIGSASEKLLQLKPSVYNFNTEEFPSLGLDDGMHYGFIAQDVEEVLPELVHATSSPLLTDEEGNITSEQTEYKAIAYMEFTPLLVAGFQEQQNLIATLQSQVAALQEQINSCCTANDTRSYEVDGNVTEKDVMLSNKSIVLNQNVPNPFAEQTTINYNINDDFSKAQILFYDAGGKLIQATDITTKGAGQLNVFADDLTSGVYSFALVVDGKIIDTKKMVKQ